MKKLMFVAAAALSATVFAEATDTSITSENIVGYAKTDLVNGSRASSAQFVTVGTNGVWLTELTPNVGSDTINGTIYITILDGHGFGVGTPYAYWKNPKNKQHPKTGWYQGNTLIAAKGANDHFFEAGEGMWVTSPNADYSFTSSGEVLTTKQTFNLINGSRLLANPYPMPIKLGDLTPNVGSDTINGTIYITILDGHGFGVGTPYAYWKNPKNKQHPKTGWYQGNTLIDGSAVTFQAGASLWFTSPSANYTVTIAAPQY